MGKVDVNSGKQRDPELAVVLGLPFHEVTMADALAECERVILHREPEYMVTANLDFTRLASEDPWLRGFLFHAHRVLCDGLPLVWLSRLFGTKLSERVAGSDLVPRLLKLSAERKYRVYFLGSDEETLQGVSAKLGREMPNLELAGWHAPPFGPVDSWDNERVLAELKESRADVVLIAVGCPKQEKWIAKYHRESGVPLSIGVGASLDFIVGKQIRAPRWLQRVGLEWFWRMSRSPRRLAGRYAKDALFLIRATWGQWWAMRGSDRSERAPYRAGPGEMAILYGEAFPEQRNLDSDLEALVCDCAKLSRVRGGELGQLAEYSRKARRRGIQFRIANPPRPLMRVIKACQLEGELPEVGGTAGGQPASGTEGAEPISPVNIPAVPALLPPQ